MAREESRPDPVTTEVIFNYVTGVADEMFTTLRLTSYSPNVKQRADGAAAILSPTGEIIAQSVVAPGHLGSMLGVVHHLLEHQADTTIEAGDMFVANDPFSGGGQHLPDVAVVAPVFNGDRIVAFVANIAHHADVGGMVPGSEGVVCRSIFQEGLRLPPVRLVRAGEVQRDILNIVLLNSRTPDERRGDLMAQITANTVGARRLGELYERFGHDLVAQCMQEYLAYTERRYRSAVRSIPDGTYHGEDFLDPCIYDAEKRPIRISLTLHKEADRLVFDLTGTDPQAQSAINSTINSSLSTIYVLVKMLVDPGLPSNSGYFKAVEVTIPEGCVLNPRPGAAVSSRTLACHVLGDVVAQAFSEAMPERALAGSGTHQQFSFSGTNAAGELWVDYEALAGAYGARPYHDGADAVRIHMSGALNLPVESLEQAYPLRVERYGLRPGSGGAGRYRGGLGVVRDYRALGAVSVSLSGQRQEIGPRGLSGGFDGEPAQFVLHPGTEREQRLPSAAGQVDLRPGDVISIRTPGGGGHGPPAERDPGLVAADLRDGKVAALDAATDDGSAQ